jgi:hypothetical protein
LAKTDIGELSTTVIGQSGEVVTLADVTNLSIGDEIIIESDHGYDEEGLDGDFAYSVPSGSGYYNNVTHIGKSFLAEVENISGNDVTVDREVPVGATGLNCYRNNAVAVENVFENGLTMPENKSLAIWGLNGEGIRILTDDSEEIYDLNGCTLFSPNGCPTVLLVFLKIGGGFANNKTIRNGTLWGNVRDAGYGYQKDTVLAKGAALNLSGQNNHANNLIFRDNWRSVAMNFSDGCTVTDCSAEQFTDPLREYVQWEFQAVTSTNCTFTRCTVDTDSPRAGFEPFKSQNILFDRCGGRNTLCATNASGNAEFRDCTFVWDSVDPDAQFSPNNGIFGFNRNIENSQGSPVPNSSGGSRIRRCSVDFRVVVYPSTNRVLNVVLVAPGNYGIATAADIRGLRVSYPNDTVLAAQNAGYIVRSDEAETRAMGLHSNVSFGSGNKYVRQNVNLPFRGDEWTNGSF